MAVATGQVSVLATSPTVIIAAPNTNFSQAEGGGHGPTRCVFVNNRSAQTIYLGGSTVAAGTGYPLLTLTAVTLWLYADEDLYGLSASGTQTVSFFASGQ